MLAKALARILFLGFSLVGYVFYVMPFYVKNLLAHISAIVMYKILGVKKRIALVNLSLVYKREHQESNDEYKARLENIAFRNYVHYALCFFEILERFHWSERDLGSRATVEGGNHVWRALAGGKGFFFLTAHLGNWELISRMGMLLRYPLSIVTKALRNPVFDELWQLSRKKYGLDLLKETGSGISIIKGIQKGRAVGFIFDQYTGEPHGAKSSFLGISTMCPRGLALMSTRLNAPVIPAYLIRKKNGCLHLIMEAPLDFSDIDKENPQAEAIHMQRCNDNIEKWVKLYPEQYLWVHKRFKDSVNYKTHKLPWEL